MAIASLTAQGAGVGLSTAGSYYSALGQKSALKFQATLAEINAKAADSNARHSLLKGEKREQAIRLETGQLKSQQRVAMAGNGIDLTSETASAVLTSTDVLGEIDANQTKANALREAWGHRTEAVSERNSAAMSRATANGVDPGMAAFTTLLAGAGQVAGNHYDAKNSGSLGKSQKLWSKRVGKAKSFLSGLSGL